MHPTTCPLDCPDACGVLVESDAAGAFVGLRGNPAHPYSRGALCGKTGAYGELIQSPDRLTTPLIRERGGFREASWEEALDRIAERVGTVAGPDILALPYAGSMGLIASKFPLRTMHALGACFHDSGNCDTTSSAGYAAVLGHLVGLDIEEARGADGIVIWGSDVRRTVQHLFPMIKERGKAGVPIIAIDIYRTDTMREIEAWGGRGLILQPGTDSILATALSRAAFEREQVDREFLRSECHGAARFEEHLRSAPTIAEAARATGLEACEIEDLLQLLARSKRLFLRAGSGWTRRTNGGMGMRAVCSLAAVLGKASRVHYESAEVFRFDESVIERPDLRSAPLEHVRQVALGREMVAGRFQAAFVWGHNPAETLPDSAAVRAGFSRDDLFLVVHEHFLTSTAQLADVVLPATMFVEHSDVYRSYGHRCAQYGRKAVEGPPGARSNVAAFSAIAKALDLPTATWDVTEEGLCEALIDASREHLGETARTQLLSGEPTKLEPPPGDWGTPTGKVELYSEALEAQGEPPMATASADPGLGGERAFWLVSAASIHTHNTTYLHSARHARRAGPPRCHVHPADLEALGLSEGAAVTLHNDRGRITLNARASDAMLRGTVRVDGFPRKEDVPERIGINVLNGPEISDIGNGTTYFSTRVDLTPA